MRFTLPKIYAITDRKLSGLSHKEQAAKLIDGGATLIQIRDKTAPGHDLFEDAWSVVRIAREHGVRILINDRVDIALMAEADGVHLGQEDLPPDAARSILGPNAIIGVSTHTIDQARRAVAAGNADYIAFGPIFSTNTKTGYEPAVGLSALERVRGAIGDHQLVAIGGINAKNLRSALAAGANSVAMISEFYGSDRDISTQFGLLERVAHINNNVITS